MRIHNRLFVILLAALPAMTGCQGRQPASSAAGSGGAVLAKVNGNPITIGDVAFHPTGEHGTAQPYENRSLDDVITQELLYQQGLKLGLDKDPSYRAKLARHEGLPLAAKRMELARRVFNTQIAATINLTPEDGKAYYDRNADTIATEIHLEMIKFDKRQDAEEALKKLKSGTSFESLARPAMHGKEPWDLGFVTWDKIPVDFVQTLYALKTGEATDILGSQRTGFQVVKLVKRRIMPKVGYDKIQGVVMNRLRDIKLLEANNRYVEGLRQGATIERF